METETTAKPKTRVRRKPAKKSKVPFIIGALVALLLIGGVVYWQAPLIFGNNENAGLISNISILPKPERMNVLLLGNDARRGETSARTDSIMLVSIDSKQKRVAMLSIPRDSYVSIPGHGKDKINHAAVYGGPELTAKTVSQLLGITVNNYIMVDYEGFKNIVDILGGVDYDVEANMYHWDPENGSAYQIDLKKGPQHLDGAKALQYVRFRGYASGDIARSEHQQAFFMALADKWLQPSTVLKLPSLAPELSRCVKTNLSAGDLLKLASTARFFDSGDIVAQTLPGWNTEINGISYWGIDTDNAKVVLAKLLSGETVSTVVLSNPSPVISSGSQPANNNDETSTDEADEDDADKSADKANDGTPALNQGIAKPPGASGSGDNDNSAGNSTGNDNGSDAKPADPSGTPGTSGTPETVTPGNTDDSQTGAGSAEGASGGNAGEAESGNGEGQPIVTPPPTTPETPTERPDATPGIPGIRPNAGA